MAKEKENNSEFFLIEENDNTLDKIIIKKKKFRLFNKNPLLLKQTLIATWKNKLQLVILLLLTAFATSLITGSWISYQRIIAGEKYLQLEDAKFDAVLPYASMTNTQIVNQAFSLSLGKLYYQPADQKSESALYYDNTIIGKEIKPLSSSNFQITYLRDSDKNINGIANFQWDLNHPLEFDTSNDNVAASVYGQLLKKAQTSSNEILKNHYLNAAKDLYNNLFVNFSAPQILAALKEYFMEWIKVNVKDEALTKNDQEFTNFLLSKKINYQGSENKYDLRIPDEVNVVEDIDDANGVLATKLVKKTDKNPRLTGSASLDYGMNGQWMRIYRTFDVTTKPGAGVINNFSSSYNSPDNYNLASDSTNTIFSHAFAKAAAALQQRDIKVINQFVSTAGVEESSKKPINIKVISLGLAKNYDNVNLKIFEGVYPSARDQIAISPQYARSHKIKPGNKIIINNKEFIVSAIAGDSYNIYPTINDLDPVPNTRNEYIAYVYPDVFYGSNWFASRDKTNISLMYFVPWKDSSVTKFDVSYFNDYFQKTIFNSNKISDHYQNDYNQYLIAKYLNNNPDKLGNYKIIQNLVITEGDSQFNIYNKGKKLLNSVLNSFKYASFIGVFFLVGIIVFITYLIVKKAIEKNQVSMGILKSSGYSTWKIISSYLAYPIMVLLIAIPIGWFVGLAVQVYFTELFNTIFVLPYNVLLFGFVPLLISVLVICGFVLLATLLTAYNLLQKEPLALIKQNSDIAVGNINKVNWIQQKFKDNFKWRFLLSLSKTSWKKIAVTSLVIVVATLSITATVSIPATISNMKDNYFKTQKYKNYYQYQTPIPNMPLSKYGLYAWNNLDNKNDELYYPVSGVMPWPENIIINNKEGKRLAWYNPIEYQRNSDKKDNFAKIIHFDSSVTDEAVKKDIIDKVGKHLATLTDGPLDIKNLTWSYSWMGGRGFSNSLLRKLAELDKSANKNFSSTLITFASKVLPSILGVETPDVPPGQEAITEILKQVLPGFVRQILNNKGKGAYDYFSIGHNTVAYNPNFNSEVKGSEEELVTQFQLGSAEPNLKIHGFLDVEGINPETKMLTIKSNLIDALKYNSSATSVPMVINRSFAAKFNLKEGSKFNAWPNIRTLYYLNNKNELVPLSKNNWYYGVDPTNQNPDDQGNKLIWNNSANKWNARGDEVIKDTDYLDSFGYNYDGVYDQDGQRVVSSEPKAWNDLNKIWLKLPDDISQKAKSGNLKTSDGKGELSFNITNIANSDGTWIKPFSYKVADKYSKNETDPTALLLSGVPEWYGAMLDKSVLVVDNNLHIANLDKDIEENMPLWWKNIVGTPVINKYHVVGIQDSYDTAKAYIDQKWANLILGYSYYNDRSTTKDPIYAPGVYQWFSGKLSASDDIYDIVARMSFKRKGDDYSIYGMNALDNNEEELLIANSDLLSRKKEMLAKMSEIALSASLLFIVTTILCSILIVIMITDAFTDQFRRFMSHMKAEGYTNQEINSFTLGIFTPWVILGYAVGYGFGYLTIFAFIKLVTAFAGLALPFTFIWWIIPLSFIIIAGIYLSTFIINTYQLNKMNLIALLKNDE